MDVISSISDTIESVVVGLVDSPIILLVILAVCVLDAIFPPIPSETVVIAAATVATAQGGPSVWAIALVAMIGAWVGDNLVFLLGRRVGTDRWAWMRRRRVARAIDVARRSLARRGALFIMTARFIPVGRVAVNLTAGATGYRRGAFMITSALAAIVWAAYSVGIGVLFGHVLGDQPLLATVLGITTAIILGVIVDVVISRVRRRGERANQVDSDGTLTLTR